MGFITSIYDVDSFINRYYYPIISCIPREKILDKFVNHNELSMGVKLSFELIKLNKYERDSLAEQKIEEIIKASTENIFITDIDILFNPDYKLDVLRLFIQLSRNRNLIIQWSGKSDKESLIYSEPDFSDYRRYLIKDYDVICLK